MQFSNHDQIGRFLPILATFGSSLGYFCPKKWQHFGLLFAEAKVL
jgi:hypothetical protein